MLPSKRYGFKYSQIYLEPLYIISSRQGKHPSTKSLSGHFLFLYLKTKFDCIMQLGTPISDFFFKVPICIIQIMALTMSLIQNGWSLFAQYSLFVTESVKADLIFQQKTVLNFFQRLSTIQEFLSWNLGLISLSIFENLGSKLHQKFQIVFLHTFATS